MGIHIQYKCDEVSAMWTISKKLRYHINEERIQRSSYACIYIQTCVYELCECTDGNESTKEEDLQDHHDSVRVRVHS